MEYEKLGKISKKQRLATVSQVDRGAILVRQNGFPSDTTIMARASGDFTNGALYLSDTNDYLLGLDSSGIICLVVLEKEKSE